MGDSKAPAASSKRRSLGLLRGARLHIEQIGQLRRLRIIKVAAEVIVSCRRVLVRLSSAWPSLPTWRVVLQHVQRC